MKLNIEYKKLHSYKTSAYTWRVTEFEYDYDANEQILNFGVYNY